MQMEFKLFHRIVPQNHASHFFRPSTLHRSLRYVMKKMPVSHRKETKDIENARDAPPPPKDPPPPLPARTPLDTRKSSLDASQPLPRSILPRSGDPPDQSQSAEQAG